MNINRIKKQQLIRKITVITLVAMYPMAIQYLGIWGRAGSFGAVITAIGLGFLTATVLICTIIDHIDVNKELRLNK